MSKIYLQLDLGNGNQHIAEADDDVECGRQNLKSGDPDPGTLFQHKGSYRLVLIPAAEEAFSREWFVVSCNDSGFISLRNIHASHDVKLVDGRQIAAGSTETFNHDISVSLGRARSLRISASPIAIVQQEPAAEVETVYRALDSIPLVPGRAQNDPNATMTLGQFEQSDARAVVKLIQIALRVVHQATGSDAFVAAAAVAATEIAGLDRASVLLRDRSQTSSGNTMDLTDAIRWRAVSEHIAGAADATTAPAISRTVLRQVFSDCRTQIHDPKKPTFVPSKSVQDVHSIVASPILDREGVVVGVLYGDRWKRQAASGTGCISDLEGALVEVLAGAIASGIARQEEERLRTNLAGFFSPRVAEMLASNPELLDGRDATVSILFCDIRGFSSVTEQLGPQVTIKWINSVLSGLSRCVVDRDGVLVDYVGDELMAMWGAPGLQTDHAQRAVQSAIAMLVAIEELRKTWSTQLPQRFSAGIGINTGPAQVGNVGSDVKFKYGVLGTTVNGGSRLQAATKHLGVDCLAGEPTIVGAGCRESARRLAKLRVVGIRQEMDVFEVVNCPTDRWFQLRLDYESALAEYEAQNFGKATQKLGLLIQQHPDDRPSRLLLARAVMQLDQPDSMFSPVWVLGQK